MIKTKIISWILVFVWLIVIFSFSDMKGTESHNKSEGTIEEIVTIIVDTTNDLEITKESDKQKIRISEISEWLNYPIRKVLHILEYLILVLLLYNAFYQTGIRGNKNIILCITICFLYACSDEFHQLFRERTGHFSDVVIDTFGGCIGFLIIKIWNKKLLK